MSKLSFGFSKNKPKTSLVQQPATSAFSEGRVNDSKEKIELITSIEGKKVVNKSDGSSSSSSTTVKQQVIIPLEPNREIIKKKEKPDEKDQKLTGSKQSDDLEAVRALMKDSAIRKESGNTSQAKIELKNNDSERLDTKKEKNLDKVEDANYEAVDLEHFGKACLLGMGWSEKEGIGSTNKRKITVVEPELRPKGLGLGAGYNKSSKSQRTEEKEAENNLKYVKGAYVEVTGGKNKNDIGQIVGFDDSDNRIFIKTPDSEKLISVIMFNTQLLTRNDYNSLLNKRKR